jgi:alkylation response protein AidB-like acyl-CoA dehydrogenase
MTTMAAPSPLLDDDMLARFASRASTYDRENRFFSDDFEELRAAGYLLMPVPAAFGGRSFSLSDVARQQRRLAYHAPATALATSMPLYWAGVAATLHSMGDDSQDWLLREIGGGAVAAAGHSEAGNDVPLLLSTSRAERVDGGYKLYGHKIFGSLTPVWTLLGFHAMDAADPANPKIVHGFLRRDTPGYRIDPTWDTLGMRPTRSDDTILEGAYVPDRDIVRVLPAGFAGADMFIISIFAWALLQFANVYVGIAERARDLALANLGRRTSIGLGGATMAHNPMDQYVVAEMQIAIEAMCALVERTADDWSAGVDHGHGWPAKIVATKYFCVENAKRVVDLALDASGGAGMFKSSELERLYRDVRCGGFHPANAAFTHEVVAKTALGLLGEAARW